MAFSISYEGLTRGNIRHIYSYNTPATFIPTPRPFGKTTQFLPLPLTERYPPRFYDYYPAFNIGLPRAPAFDRRSTNEIRDMLERIQKPISCQRERGRMPRSKGQAGSRPKNKVVRFQSPEPPPDGDVAENEDLPRVECDSSDKAEVKKVGPEEKQNEVKVSSSVKVKGGEWGEGVGQNREQQKKQTVGQERKKKSKSFLPPINN